MKASYLLLGVVCYFICSCGNASVEVTVPQKNTVVEILMSRRSIRNYKEQPVARATMDTILKCGINAPNGMNRQPWAIRVVDNPEFLNGITRLYLESMGEKGTEMAAQAGFRNMFRNAPTVVFLAGPSNSSSNVDLGIAGENMVIAAWSMGIGSCWLGGPIGFMKQPVAAPYVEQLKLPEGYQLVNAIAFGYPNETPEAKPRDAQKVFYVE